VKRRALAFAVQASHLHFSGAGETPAPQDLTNSFRYGAESAGSSQGRPDR
jgi:hypothetical protein